MASKLITAPGAEPILLADAKVHLRAVSGTAEDTLIALMIQSAREEAENHLNRALITQTWERYLDAFPEGIELPRPPLQSVDSIKYVDVDGALQTLSSGDYYVDDKQEPSWVVPAYGKAWPATRCQPNAVTVRFTCGYGAGGTSVPAAIRQWMLVRINTFYEHREAFLAGAAVGKFDHVDGVLDRYRIPYLA